MKDIVAQYIPPRSHGDGWRSSVTVSGLGDRRELWFDSTVEQDASADAFALMLVTLALTNGQPLRIDGPVSKTLWRNLHEFARAFYATEAHHGDRSDRPPSMKAAETFDRSEIRSGDNGAVLAFSGGVDSTFSLLCHTRLFSEAERFDVQRAVLVHGYDVAIADTVGFESLVRRVRPIAELAGVEFVKVATNFRTFKPDWEMSFGAAAAAALHLCRGAAVSGLIASSYPYREQVTPWGSASYWDHLFSSCGLQIVHDGASFDRSHKIEAMAQWPEVIPRLKFCFSGPDPGTNCGTCAKCVFVALEFKMSGVPSPSFAVDMTDEVIVQSLRAIGDGAGTRRALNRVVARARLLGIREPWSIEAERKLQLPPPSRLVLFSRRVRHKVRKVFEGSW